MGSYTAIIKRDGDWWIGWVEEVPGVNAQERSREELLTSLRVTLAEALDFNRKEARQAAESDFEEETGVGVKLGIASRFFPQMLT
jgi:predicted RNase H-like HicB family nuclease